MGDKANIDNLIAEIDRQALDNSPRQVIPSSGTVDTAEESLANATRTARRIRGINWRSDPISVDIDQNAASLNAMDQYIVMTQMGDGYPRQPRYIKRSYEASTNTGVL